MKKEKTIILITGGARSGKSAFAVQLALKYKKPVFIATAVACDKEMRDRIVHHKNERGNKFLMTIEEPYNPAEALKKIPSDTGVILLDCLTVWLGNLLWRNKKGDKYQEIEDFLSCLDTLPCSIIIVTNEVGMGLVPDNSLGRRFRDIAGEVNKRVAEKAHQVIMTVCGIPLHIKTSSVQNK